MQSRFHPMFYVLLPLAAIGFARNFQSIVYSLVIPITIVAVLFVLYFLMQKRRFSPRVTRHSNAPHRPSEKMKPKRKSSPFRVIEGRKNREDEPPRYH
jgi:hypothetical protein